MENPDLRPASFAGGLLLVLTLAAFALNFELGRPLLSQSHEARVLETAREMALSGDYLTPRLLGKPRWQKPPLPYYATVMVAEKHDADPAVPRRFVALLGMAYVLAVAGLAWAVEGKRVALLAAAVAAGSFLVLREFRLVTPDPFLTAFVTIATALFAWAPRVRAERAWLLRALGILATSLAFFAKGPIAWLLIGLPHLLLAPPTFSKSKRWGRLGLDLLLSLLPVLIWVAVLAAKAPDAFATFAAELRERVPDADSGTKRGITVYGLSLIYLVMPATIPFVASLVNPRLWHDRWTRWFVLGLAFFLVLASKKDAYLLPLAAPAAVLAARWMTMTFDRPARLPRLLLTLHLHLIPLGTLAFAGWTLFRGDSVLLSARLFAILASLASLLILAFPRLLRPYPIALLGILTTTLILTQFRPRKPEDHSRASLGHLISAHSEPNPPLAFGGGTLDGVIAYYSNCRPRLDFDSTSPLQSSPRDPLSGDSPRLLIYPSALPIPPGWLLLASVPSRGLVLLRN